MAMAASLILLTVVIALCAHNPSPTFAGIHANQGDTNEPNCIGVVGNKYNLRRACSATSW